MSDVAKAVFFLKSIGFNYKQIAANSGCSRTTIWRIATNKPHSNSHKLSLKILELQEKEQEKINVSVKTVKR